MFTGYVVPPLTYDDPDAFWDDVKLKIEQQYDKYVIDDPQKTILRVRTLFDSIKTVWRSKSITPEDCSDILDQLRTIQYTSLKKGFRHPHNWIEPYRTLLHDLKLQGQVYVHSVYDLYVALRKSLPQNAVTLYHDFGQSGTVSLALGDKEYSITWKHDYYGLPIRHEEYVRIQDTEFCQDVRDIKYADDLIHFLFVYHMNTVVVPVCVFESHAPKRLEYHLDLGGDFDLWEQIHFPKDNDELEKQQKTVIRKRQQEGQKLYLASLNTKTYKPWSQDQKAAYCTQKPRYRRVGGLRRGVRGMYDSDGDYDYEYEDNYYDDF